MSMNFCFGEGPPVDVLASAEQLYQTTIGELITAINDIKAGRLEASKATVQAVRDLKVAMELVHDERARVEKLRKHVVGAIGTGTLDLFAARDEIGRRLACLRDAAGG
jgi:hypothetical protein